MQSDLGPVEQAQSILSGKSGLTVVASLNLPAQAANVPATTVYTVPAGKAGMYVVMVYIVLTQAATTGSTFPFVALNWTDLDTGVVKGGVANELTATGLTANTVGLTGTVNGWLGMLSIEAAAGSAIQVLTSGYVSTGATPMQFAVRAKVIYLGS